MSSLSDIRCDIEESGFVTKTSIGRVIGRSNRESDRSIDYDAQTVLDLQLYHTDTLTRT